MPNKILDIMKWRYAVKDFNGKVISDDVLHEILEATRLTPSSFGVQPWSFIAVKDKDILTKLHPACFNQPKVLTCGAMLVICARQDLLGENGWLEKYFQKSKVDLQASDEQSDGFKNMVLPMIEKMTPDELKSWTQKQCYIAGMTAMIAAAQSEVDSCPMEGFMPDQVADILSLPQHIVPTLLITLGYTDSKRPPKTRFDFDDVVSIV